MVVIKFCRGLDPQIQNTIATMTNGRPSDTDPAGWYAAAQTIDENRVINNMFRLSYCAPALMQQAAQPQTHQVTFNALKFPVPKQSIPSPGNPVPMEVDATWKKPACYRCGSLEHLAPHCPHHFDIQNLSVEELQEHLEYQLTEINVAPVDLESEDGKENFVQSNK